MKPSAVPKPQNALQRGRLSEEAVARRAARLDRTGATVTKDGRYMNGDAQMLAARVCSDGSAAMTGFDAAFRTSTIRIDVCCCCCTFFSSFFVGVASRER